MRRLVDGRPARRSARTRPSPTLTSPTPRPRSQRVCGLGRDDPRRIALDPDARRRAPPRATAGRSRSRTRAAASRSPPAARRRCSRATWRSPARAAPRAPRSLDAPTRSGAIDGRAGASAVVGRRGRGRSPTARRCSPTGLDAAEEWLFTVPRPDLVVADRRLRRRRARRRDRGRRLRRPRRRRARRSPPGRDPARYASCPSTSRRPPRRLRRTARRSWSRAGCRPARARFRSSGL